MEQAIQLFGFLILTFLGFVLPIMAILLSVFREGMLKLTAQYEKGRTQSEDNIRAQLKKLARGKITDDSAIQTSLKELRQIKKRAEAKLSYLNPLKQIIRLFSTLMIAFVGIVIAILLIETNIYYSIFLILSLAGFTYAVFVLWRLIGIIIEVRKIIDTDSRDIDSRIIELLSALGEKIEKTGQYYLKKVYIVWEGEDIQDNSYITELQANDKKKIQISLRNSEQRMAKNIEIGLTFPYNFVVEGTDYYSVFNAESEQIVRYDLNMIHGNTNHLFHPLIITPLEKGRHIIRAFVKAENIEATYRHLTIKVT